MSTSFRTNSERERLKMRIIFNHPEILTPKEKSLMTFWGQLVTASALFTVLVQFPLSVKYIIHIRRDPVLNKHLLKRLYAMPLIAFPTFYYSSLKTEKYSKEYSKKYLSDLNEFELDNFETLFEQRKGVVASKF